MMRTLKCNPNHSYVYMFIYIIMIYSVHMNIIYILYQGKSKVLNSKKNDVFVEYLVHEINDLGIQRKSGSVVSRQSSVVKQFDGRWIFMFILAAACFVL